MIGALPERGEDRSDRSPGKIVGGGAKDKNFYSSIELLTVVSWAKRRFSHLVFSSFLSSNDIMQQELRSRKVTPSSFSFAT